MGELIEINLVKKTRPFFRFRTDGGEIECLIDTGANTPVWCGDESFLQICFPDVTPTKYIATISGYGSGYQVSRIWNIPSFVLADKDKRAEFRIKNLMIAVAPKKSFDFFMILSATLFSLVDYSVVNRVGQDKNRIFRIEFDRGVYCGIPQISNDDDMVNLLRDKKEMEKEDILVEYTYIFAQDELTIEEKIRNTEKIGDYTKEKYLKEDIPMEELDAELRKYIRP